jgi:glycosyltransferase involved in cell wall biosynthesis
MWQIVLTLWYVTKFIQLRPHVIHIQSKDDFIAATLAGRLLGKRIIWTDHADLKHVWRNLTVWYKNPIGKLIYLCAYLSHAITVVSKSERSLVTLNLPANTKIANKLHVIYNGVLDTANQFPSDRTDSNLTFCVASRLVTDKGIKEVINAYKSICNELTNSQLVLLGDGPDATKFHKLAKNTPSIKFLGHQSNPLPIMSQADVFIHPTYHEGFSVALVEAGMLSLPIIATSVGGNVEIINDRQTGILIPVRDSQSLARAMRELASNKDLRKKLGTSARQQYIDRFHFDYIVNESFIPLYEGMSS